jgi:2'-5' RNA ligase
MVRLFVGLELPDPIKQSLVLARGGVEGARWQTDDRLHLTLAFIGEVSHRTMRDIEGALSSVTFTPFELVLSGVDMFGDTRHPKTLWAGVQDEAPLRHLHEKVLNALERVDVATDRRRFKPHVTLARFQRGTHARIADWLSVNGTLRSPAHTVDHFTLFSSARTADGPFYAPEAQFWYAGGACHDWQDETEDPFAAMMALEPA